MVGTDGPSEELKNTYFGRLAFTGLDKGCMGLYTELPFGEHVRTACESRAGAGIQGCRIYDLGLGRFMSLRHKDSMT